MNIDLFEVFGFRIGEYAVKLSYQNDPVDFAGGSNAPTTQGLELMEKLVRRGASHSKFLRMIQVWLRVRAPRYWWSQAETYKVGTITLSQSTMHTLMKRELTSGDFVDGVDESAIEWVNGYIRTGDFDGAKANLPEGFLQTRVVNLNYQVLRAIYHDRKNHRLKEWRQFCDFIEEMPYASLIT